ncbi:MAG: ATP-binding protein [Peptococcia bacterium]
MANQDRKLRPEQLRKICDLTEFSFTTTAEIEPLQGIVGQERAVKALNFGLQMRKQGYNIFIAGSTGTGRNSYACSLIEKIAAEQEVPLDWCYLFNMSNPDEPRAVSLPAGGAIVLQEEIKNLVNKIQLEIPKTLNSEEYGRAKALILQKMQAKHSEKLENLNVTSQKLGFNLKQTEKGLMTIPLGSDGKPLEEEEYNNLDPEESRQLEERSRELELLLLKVFKELRDLEKETQEQVDKLDHQLAAETLERIFAELVEKYQHSDKILAFLQDVQEDVLLNIAEFKSKDEKSGLESILFKAQRPRNITQKYLVNILVDNSELKGAPVIVESNPTYYNLMGKIEYESHLGFVTTDFTKIKAGALHQANGGYLILQCKDLLTNNFSWNALKRALKTNQIQIENLTTQLGVIPSASLKPEPIPLDIKIVLIGSPREYQILHHYDEDFHKLFKIKADFDIEMERNPEHIYKLIQFISAHQKKVDLLDFSRDAVAKIVEYSSRLANNQEKLSTRFNDLVEIIYESDNWARQEGATNVTAKYVQQAIREKVYRSNQYEMKLQEMIEEGKMLISVKGTAVGQINGLAVLDMGDYSFGKPSRITVNTHVGLKGIINIEREAKLSGSLHDKGVLILSGYIGEKFAQQCPLSFSASICFEQLYSGIDGDSASSAELYALLSSLGSIPLQQGIAVTGSVNQKGEIQPIGGVNQKIEGFFQVCKAAGLNGEQGVIIPVQNVVNLMLNEEVIEAVKSGKFHIYAISSIEEGIEILTGLPAGIIDEDGNYPSESVFGRVQARIKRINELARDKDKNKGKDQVIAQDMELDKEDKEDKDRDEDRDKDIEVE